MTARKNDTTMTIRTNKEIKEEAREIYADLGMDLTTAVNVFLRQSVRCQGFPFDVTRDTPNAVTRRALDDAMNDRDMHGPFDTVDELMEDLDAED